MSVYVHDYLCVDTNSDAAWLQGFPTVSLAGASDVLFNPFFFQFFIVESSSCLLWFFFWLQPLMDNLEAQTYETFEKDVVKYSQVILLLCD